MRQTGDESAAHGIDHDDMTIGIVVVACLAAVVTEPPTVTITAAFMRTRSAARAGNRLY